MLDIFHKNNINLSKNILSKTEKNNLLITSYNFPPLNSQSVVSKSKILSRLKKIIKFINKSKSDIILLQQIPFNDEIITYFRKNNITPYVCDTYKVINKNKTIYYCNLAFINNPYIKITTISKKFHENHKRKKIINISVQFLNYSLSIYNIYLDINDKIKLFQEYTKNILQLINNDNTQNIILTGNFNTINQLNNNTLIKINRIFTQNQFNKILSTELSKQQNNFFFVNEGFSIPIIKHLKTIELQMHQNCINLSLLNDPIITNPKKIHITNAKPFINNKKLIFKYSSNNCNFVMKILPIWNKKWNQMKNILYNFEIKNSIINYGKKNAYNEFIISKYLSKLVENNITFCFIKTISAYKTETLPLNQNLLKKFKLLNIPNQKFYLLIQPKFNDCKPNNIFKKYQDLIVFQLQWSLFISYKLFKFVHGDIYHGIKNNVFCNILSLIGKKYTIIKYKSSIWKFPINQKLPYIILYDFEFSDFSYKNIHIYNKIPTFSISQYPIGNSSTIDKKRKYDIMGLNNILKNIGINKKIPQVSIYNNKDLLEGFDKYKITEEEFNKINKNIYILFDGTSKKI